MGDPTLMLYYIAVGNYDDFGNQWIFDSPLLRVCFYAVAGYSFYVQQELKTGDMVYYNARENLVLS